MVTQDDRITSNQVKSHSRLKFCPLVTLQMRSKPRAEIPVSHVLRNMVTVPTCAICSSAQDVEGGLQTLKQLEPSSNALFAQYRVAAQEHFLDAAAKRAGNGLVFPPRFYREQAVTHKHLNINNGV